MLHRRLTKLAPFSAIVIAVIASVASAQEVPNLTGTWSGSIVGGARFGALDHDPDQQEPVFADREKVWTLTVEKLVGVIRRDNVSVIFADEDNTFDARMINENEIELCAVEAEEATIAVCYIMMRK
jgi:hypothetical protein